MKRKRLLDERPGITKKVNIGGVDVYIRTGEDDEGNLKEFFVTINKEGDELRVYDCLAIAVSIGLQYGVPLEAYVEKFLNQSMAPWGVTSDDAIPIAKSIADYLARFLSMRYLDKEVN